MDDGNRIKKYKARLQPPLSLHLVQFHKQLNSHSTILKRLATIHCKSVVAYTLHWRFVSPLIDACHYKEQYQ